MSEETKRISLEIDATLKGDDLKSKLSEMYENVKKTEQSFASMREGMADMPVLGEMLNSQLQATETLASTVGNKIVSLMKSEGDMTEETRTRAISNLNSSARELSVLSDMQLGDQVFGARNMKQFSQSVSKSLATALDQILPQITNTIRTKINSPKAGEERYGRIHTVADMQSQLIKDNDIMSIIRNNTPEGTMKQNAAAIRNYLGIAATRAMGYHRMNEFTQGMFGRNASAYDSSRRELLDPREYIPDSFKSSYDARGYVERETLRPAQKVLSNDVRKAIIAELNNNPVLFKAAERAQLIRKSSDSRSRYGNYGDSLLIDDITDAQLDRFRKEAYKQLEVRGAGMGRYELEHGIYYDPKETSQRTRDTIASRFQSGSTRQAIEGLAFLDKLGDKDENFVRKKDVDRKELAGTRMITQKKPMLDMYQISRAMPFIGEKGATGQNRTRDITTANESDITRMLHIDQRGDRAKAFDMMSTISLDGYDPNNAAHKKVLEQIYEKGIWVNRNTGEWDLDRPLDANGKANNDYVLHKFHAAHRGEDGAVLRMLNADEMRRIQRETAARAKELGLEGNYLNMYSSDDVKEFGQLDKDGLYIANDKGKFFDAINKMYSPSRRIENNLQGKKVAVVDLGKMADGAGFASSELIRHSIQARGGSGFKGQLIPFYGKTMGDFLIRAGLAKKTLVNGDADPNGAYHYWAKSINGEEMVDLMDADIVTDASLWKNAKRQFRNANGEWYSADEINRRASALLGETSLSEMVDLDKESEANQLGTQLTSYMVINPRMRRMQLEGFKKRMAELETYEGMKKYVFANPETDAMAAELQKPGNEGLLNTQRYRDRVELYKQALLHDVSTHKFIDFSEDAEDSFTNVTNSINPLTALLQGNEGGEIPQHILDTARNALNASRKADQREYTDEDVKDILLLRRSKGADGKEISNVVDYGTDDEYVAYARSPAAFGAFVYGRNRAKEMSIIENALTQRAAGNPLVQQLLSVTGTDSPLLHKGGVFLGQEDWKTLSGADVDGDRVKRIRGIYADMVRESQDNAEKLKALSMQIDPEGNKRFGDMTLADIKTSEKVPNDVKAFIEDIERLTNESKEMGIANAAALNPMQMKLDDVIGNGSRFVLSARYGNKIYDEYASTFRKNPKQVINHGREWWDSLKLGRNFDAYLDHEDRLFQLDPDQLKAMEAYQDIKDQYKGLKEDKTIPTKEFELKEKDLSKKKGEAEAKLKGLGVFISSRGDIMNLRNMGSEDGKAWGLNINMPSVNMDGHLAGMAAAKENYRAGAANLGRAESISEAIRYNIQNGSGVYADATDEIKDYASAYLQMFPQYSYGIRGSISDIELQDLRALRSKAIASVDRKIAERRAKEGLSETAAYFKGPNGENIAKYRSEMLGKYYIDDDPKHPSINVVDNIGDFGFTTRNLENALKEDALHNFYNDPNVYLVGRNQTMMQQMRETKRIAEDAMANSEQEDLQAIEAFDSQPVDNSAAQKANEEANKAETEAVKAEVEAANARKETAEARKRAAEAQKATEQTAEQAVAKAEKATEQQARHALDYAEYTVTRTMPWMDTDTVDEHGNPAVGLENIYVTKKNGKTEKGNLPVSLAPYTPRGQKKRTMEEGRKEQASNEKYGSSSSGADALIGSSISHVMDQLGPTALTKTIYGEGLHGIEKLAYQGLKEYYTNHEEEMKQLGITFNDADMSAFDPSKTNFSYSGKDAKILDKLNALTPANLARYFVDDIVHQDRDRSGVLSAKDDTRTIISTEGKIYDPIMGNVLNESTMVSGPSGGEKEIGYTLKGIKNSKGEDVVTRFAPDYIVRDGKTGKIVIGDHKSSPHGADKGLIQGSVYAAWLDDLAEEYYKTTDENRKRELDPYKIFGQLNDKGEYESNIVGIETRDFFTGTTDRREYNQEIRRLESERIRKAQEKKYSEAQGNFGKYGLNDVPVVTTAGEEPHAGSNQPSSPNGNPPVNAQAAAADKRREGFFQEYQLLIDRYSKLNESFGNFTSGMTGELYKDREGTYADNYFGRSRHSRDNVVSDTNLLKNSFIDLYERAGWPDTNDLINTLEANKTAAINAYDVGTRAWAQNRSKRLLENAENFSLRKQDPFYKQREEIENQKNNVKEMESTLDNFILSRFEKSEISRDENTGAINGILQDGKIVAIRDAVLNGKENNDTVELMKTRLESLKTASDENIKLINDQIERDVDREIADMQEASDAVTKTHQTSGQQRENYWNKKRRKLSESIEDRIVARDALDKMLEDTETYKEDDPKRKQLERLRDQYNKSIDQESEYLNNGGFDKDSQDDLQALRTSRLNQLRHYFSGTRESPIAQIVSNGMLSLKDLDNNGDILNAGSQFYQGMLGMLDENISGQKARYTNFVDDLSRTGNMSVTERINRSYQSKRMQSLASIKQMQQEAIDLDKMLTTGKDLDGREIFDVNDTSETTQGIKNRIEEYRNFLKDVSKQAQDALDKTLPDQNNKDIARALEDIKAQSEIQTDKYQYGANQIQRSETARRRQLDMHLTGSRGAFRQEIEWRRSQYDNAVSREESYSLRRKQLDAERTRLQRQLDDDDANGKKLSTEERTGIESQLAAATNEYNALGDAINNAKQEQIEFGASGQEAVAALTAIGAKISAVARQFGARIWRKAMQETMQFVQQYDAAMTEIQMVTLKSDSEIANIGKGLVDSAVEMKAPIADVTSAATALYRQGLGDKEVQDRLEDVIKFSTTAGVKAADAVKLITVSLSSGLVESSTEAMDVISALGDSAATTAAEITKGLQKSVYAAKDVGVSYQELVSMLTAITASTQLGGNVAGTAMQTFMSRFARIGTNEIAYDEDGNEISSSNLATALRAVGIETYKNGSRRNFTEVLRELSSQWGDLSDARKSQISYAFGGTRQYSNLNALLTAFGERDENGQTAIDKYLSITEKSSGVTDEKYTHYTESLTASVTNLKNSFDALIESLVNSNVLTGFLDFLSGAIQGVTTLTDNLGFLGTVLSSIAVIAVPIISFLAGGGIPGLIAGTITAAGIVSAFAGYNAINNNTGALQNYQNTHKAITSQQEATEKLITEKVQKAREINNSRDKQGNLSEANSSKLISLLEDLNSLGVLSLNASTSIESLASSATNTAKALDGVAASSKILSDKQKQELWNGLIADIKNDQGKFNEAQQKAIVSDEEKKVARDAINYFSPEKGLAALSIIKDITPIVGAIDWTGFGNVVQKVGSNEYTTVSQMSDEEIARAFTQYLRYSRSSNENERLSVAQYAGIYEKINSVVNGEETDTKKEVKLGDYYKDKISTAVKDILAGSFKDNEAQLVVDKIVEDLNNGKSIDDVNVLDYASDVIRNNGKKTSSTNLKAIADLTYSMSEEGQKKIQGQRFDRLYNSLAISKIPVQTWLDSMKLDANSALFNSYMSNPAVAKAFSEMVDESGNYNGNQEAYQNFLNTIAAASNYYGSSVYKNNKQISENAFAAYTKRRKGTNISDLGPEYSESEMKTILGDELFSEFVSGKWTHAGEVRRRIEAYGTGTSAYTEYENATAAAKALNDGVAAFSNTRLQEIYQTIPELQEYLAVQGYSETKRTNLGYSDDWLNKQKSIIEKRIDEIKTNSKILQSPYYNLSTSIASGFSKTAYAPDALSTYSDLVSQYDTFAESQRSLNRLKSGTYTAEDLQRLSSQTGIKIRASNAANETVRANVENALNVQLGNYFDGISEGIKTLIPDNALNMLTEGMNSEDILSTLSEAGVELNEWAVSAIRDLGLVFTNGKFTPDLDGISEAFGDAITGMISTVTSSDKSQSSALNAVMVAVQRGGGVANYKNFLNQNYKDIDISALPSNVQNILGMYESGLSSTDASTLLSYEANPYMTKNSDYYNAYLRYYNANKDGKNKNSTYMKNAVSVLSSLDGWQEYLDTGNADKLNAAIKLADANKYTDEYSQFASYLTQFYGTQNQNSALMTSFMRQGQAIRNSNYLYDMLTSGAAGETTYAEVASVLGGDWTAELVKNNKSVAADQLQKATETSKEAINLLINSIVGPIDELDGYDLNVDTDGIIEKLRETGDALAMKLADYLEALGNVNMGEPSQTFKDMFTDTYNKTVQGSDYYKYGLAAALKRDNIDFQNMDASAMSTWLENNGYTSDQMTSLMNDFGWQQMYRANQSGTLSDSSYNTYLQSRQVGMNTPYSVYSNALDNLLGGGREGGFMAGLENGTITADMLNNSLSTPDNSWIRSYIESLSGGKDALEGIAAGGEHAKAGIEQLAAAMRSAGAAAESDYKNDLTEMTNILNNLKKGGQDAGKAMGQLSKKLYDAYDNVLASNRIRGKSGKQVDKTTRGIVGEFLGISDDKQIQKMTKEQMDHVADLMESSGKDAIDNGFVNSFEEELKNALNALQPGSEQYELVNNILLKAVADGEVDTSELDAVIAALQNDVLSSMNAAIGPIGTLMLSIFAAGNSITAALTGGAQLGTALLSGAKANVNLNTGNKAKYQSHGGGGGGGGGKSESAAEKLVNRVKKGSELYNHQLKMIQYQETKHQNAGELTMYGNELQREIDLEKAYQPALQENIKALKSQLNSVSKGSEDWYKLREALFSAEEQYDDITNTIEENERKLKENREAIRQTRTALEDLLTSQIEERIKKQRDMLAGTVDMQSIILDAIRQRYQDEWDLIKKDIEKKKQALEQEKSLIDERLNLRKNAADEAKKYEELAELKSQLARVSMDSTRTKDAAALREQIAKIEEEIGWNIADQQAESEKQQIDDQIKGYDEFVAQGDEDLSKFLEDTNNFAQEITTVLGMSHDELFAWLKNNVTDFKNSLDEVQQQMIDSWEDTYKQMFGITDTYWEQVNAILSNKDTFLGFMRESDEYVNASETEKQSLIYEWEKLYDDYVKARLNGPVGSHSDEGYGDWYGSEYTGADGGGGGGGSGGSSGGPGTGTKYYGVFNREGKLVKGFTDESRAKSYLNMIFDNEGYTVKQITKAQYDAGPQDSGPSKPKADTTQSNNVVSTVGSVLNTIGTAVTKPITTIVNTIGNLFSNNNLLKGKVQKADTGAYTGDQEGLIYVHKKERILNPQQTESFERLTRVAESMNRSNAFDGIVSKMNDWSSNTVVPIDMPSFSPSDFKNSTTTTIGDIIITLNEAKLENDADYEAVAQRVGEKFVKELTKQGLGVSAFGF